jgi:hypothetical protein
MQVSSVGEYEDRFQEWWKRTGDEVLSYPYLAGIIEAIVEGNGPAEHKIAEIRNAITAFHRLRGKRAADRDPQPAG